MCYNSKGSQQQHICLRLFFFIFNKSNNTPAQWWSQHFHLFTHLHSCMRSVQSPQTSTPRNSRKTPMRCTPQFNQRTSRTTIRRNKCLSYRPLFSLQWEQIKVMANGGSETSKLFEESFVTPHIVYISGVLTFTIYYSLISLYLFYFRTCRDIMYVGNHNSINDLIGL